MNLLEGKYYLAFTQLYHINLLNIIFILFYFYLKLVFSLSLNAYSSLGST